jgi:aspartokinase
MREAPAPHAVHKFGGAALGDAPAIQRVVALLAECAPGGRVVVTSALSGVTDALLAAAALAALGDAHQAADDARRLRERHHDVASALLEGDVLDAARAAIDASYDALDALLTGVSEARRIDARVTDLVLSRGERLAAMLVCGALAGTGVRAHVMDAASATPRPTWPAPPRPRTRSSSPRSSAARRWWCPASSAPAPMDRPTTS